MPAQEPIQRASVILLFSLRPEAFSKLSRTFWASESGFSEPSISPHIGLIQSQCPSLINHSCLHFTELLWPEFRLKERRRVRRDKTALVDTPVDRKEVAYPAVVQCTKFEGKMFFFFCIKCHSNVQTLSQNQEKVKLQEFFSSSTINRTIQIFQSIETFQQLS